MINFNSKIIWESGAKVLVTPCPICYKVFKESYYLEAEVMHHTQYIDSLIDSGRLRLRFTGENVVYHDPCELGRGSGVYEEPRKVLKHISRLKKPQQEKEMGLCCGGSIANLNATRETRRAIATAAADTLAESGAGTIATGCPLCKKTFSPVSGVPVKDIAELVVASFYGKSIENEPAVKSARVLEKHA
jgi:Fe-S oxidoreductase